MIKPTTHTIDFDGDFQVKVTAEPEEVGGYTFVTGIESITMDGREVTAEDVEAAGFNFPHGDYLQEAFDKKTGRNSR